MAPAKVNDDGGSVSVPLDEHTKAIAEAAAREAVREHMATCPIMSEFRTMHADFYGPPGEKSEHPGTMGEVQSLKEWRGAVTGHLVRLWAAAVVIAGALIGPLWAWANSKQ
jgi:hypothetical protein